MMWCLLMLVHDVDLEDVGGWQLVFALGRYFSIFIGGHYSLEDQDVVITRLTVLLQITVVDFGTATSTDL